MSSARTISVIIPNYNGRQLLEDYLPHTFQTLDETGAAYEVIVIDDCSKDDSVAFIRQHYPQIKLLQNDKNRGFSYTCNHGIKVAQYELTFLLNSDIKLLPGYFAPLWKYFDRPDTFGVTGRMIDMEGDRIQDAARMPGFSGYKIKTKYFYYCDAADARTLTFYLSGANALVSTEKLKAMDGFDEIYSPFYYEDMDLCIRAWRAGWVCYYDHAAICRHKGSATTKSIKPAWVKSIYYRNRFFVHAIHLEGFARLMWFLQATFTDVLPKLIIGRAWVWKSYKGYLKGGRKIDKSRGQLHKLMDANNSHVSLQTLFKHIQETTEGQNIKQFKA